MVARAKESGQAPAAMVNVSSDAGRRGTVGQINYGAAKAGVLGITMSAAREWGRHGVRVNSVCFGVVETQMTEVIRSESGLVGGLEPGFIGQVNSFSNDGSADRYRKLVRWLHQGRTAR